jgi:hypothetical protein
VKTIYLIVAAIILGLLGLVYLITPSIYLGALGISLSDPSALNMIRSFGGFYIAFAGFLFLAVRRPTLAGTAIAAATFVMAGLVAGRILGFIIDGPVDRAIIVSMVVEIILLIWGGILLKKKY